MNPIPPIIACVPDDAEVRRRIEQVMGDGHICEPHPDSGPAECTQCGCKVWVNPTQQIARLHVPEASIHCLPCALPEVVFGAPILALSRKEAA